jgi:hypothetical protein
MNKRTDKYGGPIENRVRCVTIGLQPMYSQIVWPEVPRNSYWARTGQLLLGLLHELVWVGFVRQNPYFFWHDPDLDLLSTRRSWLRGCNDADRWINQQNGFSEESSVGNQSGWLVPTWQEMDV